MIILTMDSNEYVLNGSLCRSLLDESLGLGLTEISHKAWDGHEPNTYIDGSKPIDGVWASRCLKIGGFRLLLFGESVGDHRTMIFDVSTRSLIGKFEHRVVRASCSRLNCKTYSLFSYTKILEQLMDGHKMDDRLDAIIDAIIDDRPTAEQNAKMEALDRQIIELQTCTE